MVYLIIYENGIINDKKAKYSSGYAFPAMPTWGYEAHLHFDKDCGINNASTKLHEVSHLLNHDGLVECLLLALLIRLGNKRQDCENNKAYLKFKETYEHRA